jgi:hypothetical protein
MAALLKPQELDWATQPWRCDLQARLLSLLLPALCAVAPLRTWLVAAFIVLLPL